MSYIYADLESLTKGIDGYANNPERSSSKKQKKIKKLNIFTANIECLQ